MMFHSEYHRFKSYDEVILDELQRSFGSTLRAFSPHVYKTKAPEIAGEWANTGDAKHNHLKE
ncbi:hypothetical protein QFZ87_003421 [Bacillus sp. SLBN-46]|jgi:hypothetical protein|nr:hypothetical protein [Bacillus sp. SLBN-46]